jgi:cytochrome c oxidase subunit 1
MFVSGMQGWIRVPMMVTTAIIAVPTGIKIFSWLATLWRGVLRLDTPMLFALGFLTMFTLGGISGVMLAMIPLTIHVSDTYFIVAHIHYVLFGGSLFTIFAGVYFWFPKMTGRMYDETLGKLHFWSTFVFFNATFAPDARDRRPGHAAARGRLPDQFAAWNLFISLSSFVLGLSTLIFVYNMVRSWRDGPARGANPWRALTLEWQVSSPARRSSTSTGCRRWSAGRTSTASPARSTGSSGPRRRGQDTTAGRRRGRRVESGVGRDG